jgi:glycosyltransferase involved in cell wall biosynthesis
MKQKKILLISRPVDNYIKGGGIYACLYWLKKKLKEDKYIRLFSTKKYPFIPTSSSLLTIIVYDIINPLFMAAIYGKKAEIFFFGDSAYTPTINLIKLLLPKKKYVTIVQDFNEKKDNSLYYRYFNKIAANAIANCDYIICTAEENKNIILAKKIQVDPEKICVLPLGFTSMILESDTGTVNRSKKDKEFHIGYIGDSQGHKRIDRLVEIIKKFNELEVPLILTTAGKINESYTDQFDSLQNEYFQYNHLGRITEEEKVGFYTNINALMFPSEREGFGLPLLESMYLQKLAIIFGSSQIPSLLKQKCLLLEDDLKNLKEIYNYITSEKKEYREFIINNFKYSQKFDWHNYVEFFRNI